jgi:TonB family protein
MPKMIKAVPPSYPPMAYRLKRSGEVWIRAHVDAEGKVQDALVQQGPGGNYGFEEAALAAAYKNQFEPFKVNGVGVPIWVIYKVRFVVKD